jgi:inorganic triphosphatase YgiF
MAHETEIKLAATPEMLAALRRDPRFGNASEEQQLVSTYFDTADRRLANACVRLRVRAGDERFEQTLKRARDGGIPAASRIEYSCRTACEEPVLSAFPDTAGRIVKRLVDGQQLVPIARTRIAREARIVRCRRSVIEVAFDQGSIEAQGKSSEICELELELKEGGLRDLLWLARSLPLGADLFWSVSSKGARAIGLASGRQERPSRTEPILLRPTMPVSSAFRRIGWNCLNHLLRNYRLMIDNRDAEALHQCRVALRRLRIAAAIFGPIVDADETPLLTAQWKAVADALGSGRSLDVVIARVAGHEAVDPHYVHPAKASLVRLREAAYNEIEALVGSASFQHMLFDTALWIEVNASRRAVRLAGGRDRLPAFASNLIRRQRVRLREPVRRLSALSPRERHRLRIKVKRMRYTSDFFSSLPKARGTAKRLRAFLMLQETLQDQLGDLNDLAPARAEEIVGMGSLDAIEQAIVQALGSQIHPIRPAAEKALVKAASRTGRALLKAGKRLP